MEQTSADADRRTELLAVAAALRPELHRYCARLMGSVIEGEDVVQDTLERALAALPGLEAPPAIRPWLFRIAHHRAVDLIRSRSIRRAEPLAAAAEIVDEATPDPVEMMMRKEAIRTAVSRFVELPVPQRSAVILKDVLDAPLSEIASLLDLSVDAVKAHLARGRARLRQINTREPVLTQAVGVSAAVAKYVSLFNHRDWDGLRALLADDVRLNQATHPIRVGAADVSMFFGIYSRSEPVRLAPAWLDGREVIAVFDGPAAKPSYFMWIEWRDGSISSIHDYRHARYVAMDADLQLASDEATGDLGADRGQPSSRN